ncbi:RepB family plasmid replication initiator protein [Photobacterium sp. OFAV2-7]|uniref:RepB family plasmid replication initiator protein n=1 Tax=Photobacterium sp. OFAV2-7 TaxID=2917748 RepID=UPI001EF7270C|nr:RepB family plasmid replication initiator protein [Photobacterium sp. OFAV2-7]MCG7584582.1 RepB family plasmid replication initiator protein [Photobacterium sp. OFAV2-7]
MEKYELLLKEDTAELERYRYNAALDAKENIFRVSNEVIKGLIAMNGPSWRMFEAIARHIDLYPLRIKADDEFIAAFNQGKRYIPSEYRTVTLAAADYVDVYQLSNNTGRKQFVRDAISLYEESVELFQGDSLKVSRPINEIEFHLERRAKGAKSTEEVVALADMKGDKPVATQAARITFELNEKLALAMLFVVKNFTRLDNNIKSHLSPVANKLYTYLKMTMDSQRPVREQHILSWDLATWNRFLNTNYASITRLKDRFNLHTQITDKTDLTLIADIDREQKTGRAYTHFYVMWMKTPTHELIEQGKPVEKPSRKRLPPRPRVVAGSHAEGEWAKKCLAILKDFEDRLNALGRILPKADRDKRDRYNKILGRS